MRKRRRLAAGDKDQGPIFGLGRHDVDLHHCRSRLLSTTISAPPRLPALLLAALLCCSVTSAAAHPRANFSSLSSASDGNTSGGSLVRTGASTHSSTRATPTRTTTANAKVPSTPPPAKPTPHHVRMPVPPLFLHRPSPAAAQHPHAPPPSPFLTIDNPAALDTVQPVVRIQQPVPGPVPELPPLGARSLDLQFFTGSLAGAAPPGIVWSSIPAKPFRVDNETFIDFRRAGEHSCELQLAACTKAATAAGGGPQVVVLTAECKLQKEQCLATQRTAPLQTFYLQPLGADKNDPEFDLFCA